LFKTQLQLKFDFLLEQSDSVVLSDFKVIEFEISDIRGADILDPDIRVSGTSDPDNLDLDLRVSGTSDPEIADSDITYLDIWVSGIADPDIRVSGTSNPDVDLKGVS
jgi:hypothetical protein